MKRELKSFLIESLGIEIEDGTTCELITCELNEKYWSGIGVTIRFPIKNLIIEMEVDSSLLKL